MSDWRPIETAPKDGTWILVFAAGIGTIPAVAAWHRFAECWITVEDEDALENADSRQEQDEIVDRNKHWTLTHWMPLPEPPEAQ